MALVEIEFQFTDAFRVACCAFRLVKDPAVWQDTNHTVFRVCDWIPNGLAARAKQLRHLDAGYALLDVPVKFDLGEDWIVQFFDDHAEDLEHCAGRLILTAQNVEDGVLLLVGDRVFEDWLQMAFAVVDRPREKKGGHNFDPVQRDALAVPLIDLEGDCTGAVSLGRGRHGLAGTTHVATAVFDVASFDGPVSACHDILLGINGLVNIVTSERMLWEAMAPAACSGTSSTSATGACAVVYTDKGHGNGFHILEADTVNILDGRQISAEEAGRDAHFRADLDDAARHRLLEDCPIASPSRPPTPNKTRKRSGAKTCCALNTRARSLAKEF